MLGGPVLKPNAGAASSSSGSSTKKAAAPGRRSARSAIATHGLAVRAPPNCQRLTFVPSTASSAGIASSATSTATIVATNKPSAEETSSAPGASSSAVSIPIASAVPANSTVRPARAAVSCDRVRHGAAGRQLLAEARDDEQRVVDAEREPDHRDHVERERVDLHARSDQAHQRGADARHEQAADRRHERRERAAEDRQQHHEQDRQRDQLALVERVQRGLVDRAHQRRLAGEVDPQPASASPALEHALDGRRRRRR